MYIEPVTARFILNLLKGIKSEKDRGFEILHENYSKIIERRLIIFYGCSEELAKDIINETYIRIFKTELLPEPEALASWIMKIARNIHIDLLRKDSKDQDSIIIKLKNNLREKIKDYENLLNIQNNSISVQEKLSQLKEKLEIINYQTGTIQYEETIQSLEENTSEKINNEIEDCVQKAIIQLGRISPEREEVINLSLRDYSSVEIAKIIGRTEKATRQFLSESRKALRKFVEPCKEYLILQ